MAKELPLLVALLAITVSTATALRSAHQEERVVVEEDLPPLLLEIVGTGTSPSNPALGYLVTLRVSTPEGVPLPPWVSIQRADLKVAFGYIETAHHSTAWGAEIDFNFGEAVDNAPIPVYASGWSAEYNGTVASQNSSALTVYYAFTNEEIATALVVAPLGPGSCELTFGMKNRTHQPALVYDAMTFNRFIRGGNASATPPEFVYDFFYRQVSESGKIILTFQEPGIYYYGATSSYQGRPGQCTAGGMLDGRPSTYPDALVVLGPNGETGNVSLPPGFAGQVHVLPNLRTQHQFCIVHRNLTVFSGAVMEIPLCRPKASQEIPPQPGFVSVVAPKWFQVLPRNNNTCPSCTNKAYWANQVNRTVLPQGDLVRYTFESYVAQLHHSPIKEDGRWSIYNDVVPLYLRFDASHITHPDEGGALPSLSVMIHANQSDATAVPVSDWQTLTLRCVATPRVAPPKRLVTSITWSSESVLLDEGGSGGGVESSSGGQNGTESGFLTTYAGLGFNTVPLVSMPAFFPWSNGTLGPTSTNAPASVDPTKRKHWNKDLGLRFGPQISGPVVSNAAEIVAHTVPDASKLPSFVAPDQRPLEMRKWNNSFQFFKNTRGLDVAYDGAFLKEEEMHFCALMGRVQPEWIFMDDENFGAGFQTWRHTVVKSENALARRVPNETDFDLAWRMALELMQSWTSCLPAVSPKTTLGWYDTPFPDAIFSGAGISMQPSVYSSSHLLTSYPAGVRMAKLTQAKMVPSWKPRHLLPWLTSCTYGQMTAVSAWEAALHTFGGGATGFSYFSTSYIGCLDDPAKLLAYSTATALATPYEDYFMDGAPMLAHAVNATLGQLRAWSGVCHHSSSRSGPGNHDTSTTTPSCWMVFTPGVLGATLPSNVTVLVTPSDVGPPASSSTSRRAMTWVACDLTTGEAYDASTSEGGVIELSMKLARTTVVHLSSSPATWGAGGASCASRKLADSVWLPVEGY